MSNPELREIPEPAMGIPQDALYEISNVQQVRGEPRRKWFCSHEMDLIVWFDEEDKPISFQLAYDKHRRLERVIRWNPAHGYSHHRVDEQRRPSAGSALLVPDGVFDAPRVRSRFLALSPGIPWVVTEYVSKRLLAHPAQRSRNSARATLILAALVAIPFMILACRESSRARMRRARD